MHPTSKAVLTGALLLAVGSALPAPAQELEEFPQYSGDQLNQLFTTAPLDGLAPLDPPPPITGSADIDLRIRQVAQERGYRLRPVARRLSSADGFPLQAEAAAAWEELQAAAAGAGHPLRVTSGYRSVATQRSLFLDGLDRYTHSAIDAQLAGVAPPGYSKHHTGYALDITQRGWPTEEFVHSPGWAWLSADHHHNAKRFGFVPSYPQDATRQGPDPEPWEWTYVGVEVIRCGGFHLGYQVGEEAANPTGTVYDLETCGDLALTRGAVAHYLAGALDLEGNGDTFGDDDGTAYEQSVEAVAAAGVTSGCNPPANDRFCPRQHITRAETAAFLDRALGLSPTDIDHFSDDDGSPLEASIDRTAAAGIVPACDPPANHRFCPADRVTRSELLAFLDRAVQLPEREAEHRGSFSDDDGSVFQPDIEWLAEQGIARGCNPPVNDRFCPRESVTRGEMAAFLARALHLEEGAVAFSDTEESVFAGDVAALAEAGITRGCDPPIGDRFCPRQLVTRGQMAAFLRRALDLERMEVAFQDTAGHLFQSDIAALAAAGITRGCDPPHNDRYCPDQPVTRAQMAAFLRRALQ